MKKRLLAVVLAAVMLLGLAACSTTSSSGGASSTPAGDSSAVDSSTPGDSSTPEETGSEAVELWVVRHGETLFNVKGFVQGWSDAPLTENGVASSGYVGAGLKDAGIVFDAAYTSDMTRCIETAGYLLEAMGSSLTATPDARFREMNFGVYEGTLSSELRGVYPDIYEWETFGGFEGGEDWHTFIARIEDGLTEIGEAHASTGGKILVTAHGFVQAALMFDLAEDFVPSSDALPNNGAMVVEYKDGALTLKSAPDKSYLEKGMELAGVEPTSAAH